jgi:hypothetical protein
MKPTIIVKSWVAAGMISVCSPGQSLSAEALQERKLGYTSTIIGAFSVEFARRVRDWSFAESPSRK